MNAKTLAGMASALCLAATAGALAAAPDAPKRPLPGPIEATPALTAAQGSARAMALIGGNGTIKRSKGIVTVTHAGTGQYCIVLKPAISAATAVPIMAFDYNSSPDFDVFVTYASLGSCGVANAIVVNTYNADAGGHTFADEGFTFVVP